MRYEYACHVKDFIARRTRLAFLNVQAARECLPRVCSETVNFQPSILSVKLSLHDVKIVMKCSIIIVVVQMNIPNFQVAELMAEELGWNEEQLEAEIKDAEGLIKSMG